MTSGGRAGPSPQWLRATRWQLRLLLTHVLVIWAVAAIALVVVLAVAAQVGEMRVSAIGSAIHPLLWWPFVIAIIMASTHLPVHLAHGMTRSACTRAALAASLVISVLNATLAMLALLVERAVYERLGWTPALSAGNVTGTLDGGELDFAAGLAMIFVAAMVSGLLVGVVYYRVGGWWGTLTLPLTLLPVLGTSALALGEGQWRPVSLTLADDVPAGEVMAVALIIGSATAFALLVRRLPVRTRRS